MKRLLIPMLVFCGALVCHAADVRKMLPYWIEVENGYTGWYSLNGGSLDDHLVIQASSTNSADNTVVHWDSDYFGFDAPSQAWIDAQDEQAAVDAINAIRDSKKQSNIKDKLLSRMDSQEELFVGAGQEATRVFLNEIINGRTNTISVNEWISELTNSVRKIQSQ